MAGAHINFVTVRGEHATFQGYGLYYYDPASVAREGIIWDVIDLCLALPLFIVAIVLSWRGSLRGQLLLGGMLFYFFYKYMMYAVMLSFNPLFLVYVAIFALSAVAFFLNLGGIKVSSLPSSYFGELSEVAVYPLYSRYECCADYAVVGTHHSLYNCRSLSR